VLESGTGIGAVELLDAVAVALLTAGDECSEPPEGLVGVAAAPDGATASVTRTAKLAS
jgi:hypothetical protein